jgi:putative transposase
MSLGGEFTAKAPNIKSVADITGVWAAQGWLYLAVVVDLYSQLIVGWAMDAHQDEALSHMRCT